MKFTGNSLLILMIYSAMAFTPLMSSAMLLVVSIANIRVALPFTNKISSSFEPRSFLRESK